MINSIIMDIKDQKIVGFFVIKFSTDSNCSLDGILLQSFVTLGERQKSLPFCDILGVYLFSPFNLDNLSQRESILKAKINKMLENFSTIYSNNSKKKFKM